MSFYAVNGYITEAQMEHNATIIYDYFTGMGWTVESVCGMLGNMESESGINPGVYQNRLNPPNLDLGFGLVQWTPATKLISWAGSTYQQGNRQCDRILYESVNGIQWFRNPNAPIIEPALTFAEFTISTLPVGELANYFLWYYEHPAETIQPNRATQAEQWYEYLSGSAPDPEPPDPPSYPDPTPLPRYKKIPLWMLCRRPL